MVEVEEPLVKSTIQFWDHSYRCFIFNGEDLVPTTEEYSILIRLNLQCLDKVYYRRARLKVRKKLAKITGIKPEYADGYLVSKEKSIKLEWVFLRDFINSGLAILALSIYGLVIFHRVIGHMEMIVIDFFK